MRVACKLARDGFDTASLSELAHTNCLFALSRFSYALLLTLCVLLCRACDAEGSDSVGSKAFETFWPEAGF